MKIIDPQEFLNYEIHLDYISNNASIKWHHDKDFHFINQRETIKDILSRPQDIKNSNIFERRFLIKKVFDNK